MLIMNRQVVVAGLREAETTDYSPLPMSFRQGRPVRLRGVEPSEAETFARRKLGGEAALLVLKYYCRPA